MEKRKNFKEVFIPDRMSDGKTFTTYKEKILNEAEMLSIKRLRQKKVPYEDIADRIGISVERVKAICKHKKQ